MVLTRPAAQNQPVAQRLAAQGRTVVNVPALALTAVVVEREALDVSRYDVVIFVSGNAVRFFCAARAAAQCAVPWPSGVALAAVGPATVRAMRDHLALPVDAIIHGPCDDSPTFDSEALLTVLRAGGAAYRRVLIVRATTGREWLASQLRATGAQVDVVAVYARTPAPWTPPVRAQFDQWRAQGVQPVWLYTSQEGLSAVQDQAAQAGLAAWWRECPAVVTHPRVGEALRRVMAPAGRLAPPVVKVCLPDDEAIFEAIVSL